MRAVIRLSCWSLVAGIALCSTWVLPLGAQPVRSFPPPEEAPGDSDKPAAPSDGQAPPAPAGSQTAVPPVPPATSSATPAPAAPAPAPAAPAPRTPKYDPGATTRGGYPPRAEPVQPPEGPRRAARDPDEVHERGSFFQFEAGLGLFRANSDPDVSQRSFTGQTLGWALRYGHRKRQTFEWSVGLQYHFVLGLKGEDSSGVEIELSQVDFRLWSVPFELGWYVSKAVDLKLLLGAGYSRLVVVRRDNNSGFDLDDDARGVNAQLGLAYDHKLARNLILEGALRVVYYTMDTDESFPSVKVTTWHPALSAGIRFY